MTNLVQRATSRNQLYALAVLPPVIFLVTGHVVLGLLFVLCVVGGTVLSPTPRETAEDITTPCLPSAATRSTASGARLATG